MTALTTDILEAIRQRRAAGENLGGLAREAGQLFDTLRATGWTLVDRRLALRQCLCVAGAVRVAASRALRLGQDRKDLGGQQVHYFFRMALLTIGLVAACALLTGAEAVFFLKIGALAGSLAGSWLRMNDLTSG